MSSISPASIPSITTSLSTLIGVTSGVLTPTNVQNGQPVIEAVLDTLYNYLSILNGYYIQFWMSQEFNYLETLNPAAMGLTSINQSFINNRIASFNSLVNTVYPLPLWIPFDLNNLLAGEPAIQTLDLLVYFATWGDLVNNVPIGEVPPTGLTLDNFHDQAQACADAWGNVLAYWNVNLTFNPAAYNAVDRMYYASQTIADSVADVLDSAPLEDVSLPKLWNMLVALPSLLAVADILMDNPSNPICQSVCAIRFYLLNLIFQINPLLATFFLPNTPIAPATGELRAGETLMDFAARTTGSAGNWNSIAQINGLMPPYVVPLGTPIAAGVATPGQVLYLTVGPTGTPVTNYFTTYLGTDINLGTVGIDLLTWAGEFNTINGYNNLQYALARRVLTTIGSLIFHRTYGSKIPPEVGKVQTSIEANLLLSYLKSSLLTDPRVATVSRISAVPIGQDQAALLATVIPNGNVNNVPFGVILTQTKKS